MKREAFLVESMRTPIRRLKESIDKKDTEKHVQDYISSHKVFAANRELLNNIIKYYENVVREKYDMVVSAKNPMSSEYTEVHDALVQLVQLNTTIALEMKEVDQIVHKNATEKEQMYRLKLNAFNLAFNNSTMTSGI